MSALAVLVPLVAATAICAVIVRRRFLARAGALVRRLEAAPLRAPARSDLPPEVMALARRLGARSGATIALFRQSGEMTMKLGGAATPFVAEQTAAVGEVGFVWRANFPRLATVVVDAVVGDEARLEARLAGIVPVVRLQSCEALWRGEAMRYLAELPWNPDAILANHALRWRVVDARRLAVATGEGARIVEVTFTLDDAGNPATGEALDRPRMEGSQVTPTCWIGRFSDEREFDGRRIPTRGEVAWAVDGRECVYWRGRIESWRPGS